MIQVKRMCNIQHHDTAALHAHSLEQEVISSIPNPWPYHGFHTVTAASSSWGRSSSGAVSVHVTSVALSRSLGWSVHSEWCTACAVTDCGALAVATSTILPVAGTY